MDGSIYIRSHSDRIQHSAGCVEHLPVHPHDLSFGYNVVEFVVAILVWIIVPISVHRTCDVFHRPGFVYVDIGEEALPRRQPGASALWHIRSKSEWSAVRFPVDRPAEVLEPAVAAKLILDDPLIEPRGLQRVACDGLVADVAVFIGEVFRDDPDFQSIAVCPRELGCILNVQVVIRKRADDYSLAQGIRKRNNSAALGLALTSVGDHLTDFLAVLGVLADASGIIKTGDRINIPGKPVRVVVIGEGVPFASVEAVLVLDALDGVREGFGVVETTEERYHLGLDVIRSVVVLTRVVGVVPTSPSLMVIHVPERAERVIRESLIMPPIVGAHDQTIREVRAFVRVAKHVEGVNGLILVFEVVLILDYLGVGIWTLMVNNDLVEQRLRPYVGLVGEISVPVILRERSRARSERRGDVLLVNPVVQRFAGIMVLPIHTISR